MQRPQVKMFTDPLEKDEPIIEINQGPFGVSLSLLEAHDVLEQLQDALFVYAGKRLEKVLASTIEKEKKPHLQLVK